MLMPVVAEVFGNIGITKDDVGFICSGSTDYLIGGPFSLRDRARRRRRVAAPGRVPRRDGRGLGPLRGLGAPAGGRDRRRPRLLPSGGRRSGDLSEILAVQLDPYYLAPLWPDPTSLAALQAQAMIDKGTATEADFAAIASRSRRSALANPKAQVAYDRSPEELLAEDYVVAPLRRHALPPLTDGCAAVVLAAGDQAYELVRAAGVHHRHRPPHRDALARRPRPDRVALDEAGGREGRGGRQDGRRGRAARPLRPPGDDPGRGARAGRRRRRQPVGRRRWRPTR